MLHVTPFLSVEQKYASPAPPSRLSPPLWASEEEEEEEEAAKGKVQDVDDDRAIKRV
jgi:hypothetical protein